MGKFVEGFKKVAAKQRGAVAINRRVEDVGGLDVKQLRQVSDELVVLGGERRVESLGQLGRCWPIAVCPFLADGSLCDGCGEPLVYGLAADV
jgi:hypothetical protein